MVQRQVNLGIRSDCIVTLTIQKIDIFSKTIKTFSYIIVLTSILCAFLLFTLLCWPFYHIFFLKTEKVVEPNQKNYPWYHQEFRRVPTIDQCYTDDVACHFEANQQFRRDKMIENEILSILRQRFEDCVLYETPDHLTKCRGVLDTYEKAAENWFTKCKLCLLCVSIYFCGTLVRYDFVVNVRVRRCYRHYLPVDFLIGFTCFLLIILQSL